MQFVRQQITQFTSTNLTDTYNDYNPNTTYTFESGTPTNSSVVRYGNYYYRSLVNNNLGFDPVLYENVKWVKYGVSNKFAMVDLASQSKSVYEGDMTVTFVQGLGRTLGVGYYDAEYITVQILDTDGTTVLWTYDVPSPLNENVVDWWTYIYSTYGYESNKAVKIDLPLKGSFVKVTFHKSTESSFTSCGFLVLGEAVHMGDTLANVNFSYNSFATKEFDDFGTLRLTKRAVQDLVDFETLIPAREIQTFKRELKRVYNDVVLFVIDESENSRYENLLILGIIQDASTVLTDFSKSIMTFSILEVI
jgi:hypothetical protein